MIDGCLLFMERTHRFVALIDDALPTESRERIRDLVVDAAHEFRECSLLTHLTHQDRYDPGKPQQK